MPPSEAAAKQYALCWLTKIAHQSSHMRRGAIVTCSGALQLHSQRRALLCFPLGAPGLPAHVPTLVSCEDTARADMSSLLACWVHGGSMWAGHCSTLELRVHLSCMAACSGWPLAKQAVLPVGILLEPHQRLRACRNYYTPSSLYISSNPF